MQLYTYFRSSAAYRVRIALGLKGLDWTAIPVHLVRDGGEQHSATYKALNPGALVPTLKDGGAVINQSLAIIEYLDERHPEPPLLPVDAVARAQVRALAYDIACDVHPLNNLRVLQYLENQLQVDAQAKQQWYLHWVKLGLEAFEQQLANHQQAGPFCYGEVPTLADICLVPQVFNAHRFGFDTGHLARITRAVQACEALPAFQQARPERQADAQ